MSDAIGFIGLVDPMGMGEQTTVLGAVCMVGGRKARKEIKKEKRTTTFRRWFFTCVLAFTCLPGDGPLEDVARSLRPNILRAHTHTSQPSPRPSRPSWPGMPTCRQTRARRQLLTGRCACTAGPKRRRPRCWHGARPGPTAWKVLRGGGGWVGGEGWWCSTCPARMWPAGRGASVCGWRGGGRGARGGPPSPSFVVSLTQLGLSCYRCRGHLRPGFHLPAG